MPPLVCGDVALDPTMLLSHRLRGGIRVIRLRRIFFPKTLQFIQSTEQTLVSRSGVAKNAVHDGPVKDEALPEFFGFEVQKPPLLPNCVDHALEQQLFLEGARRKFLLYPGPQVLENSFLGFAVGFEKEGFGAKAVLECIRPGAALPFFGGRSVRIAAVPARRFGAQRRGNGPGLFRSLVVTRYL